MFPCVFWLTFFLSVDEPASVPSPSYAPAKQTITLDPISVSSASPADFSPSQHATIFEGKKTTVSDVTSLPSLTSSNPRETFILTPGLLVSEVSSGAWLSLSYRGIGEPHESWNMLVLKDGIPVSPDMYSYPAAYYVPPSESLSSVELVRGGASLVYGPQPGAALNFVTRLPRRDAPIQATSKWTYGSFDQLTTYNTLQGTEGRVGYLVDFARNQMSGFRERNGDSQSTQGSATVYVDPDRARRYMLRFDSYAGDFGDPGGLSAERMQQSRGRASSVSFDRFRVQRHIGSGELQQDFGTDGQLELRLFGGFYERASRRQAASLFGELTPDANVSIVQRQLFYIGGGTLRVQHGWQLGKWRQAFSVGTSVFMSHAPVQIDKGNSATDDEGRGGALTRMTRGTMAFSLFAENAFHFAKLSIVPGVRLELLRQYGRETLDLRVGDATVQALGPATESLTNRDTLEPIFVPGLGAQYDLSFAQIYANVSRGYKPTQFNDGVAFQSDVNVANAFRAGYAWSSELGVRGRPFPGLTFDLSGFFIDNDNQVGLVGQPTGAATRTTLGKVQSGGAELSLDLDVLALIARRAPRVARFGSLSVFGSMQALDARWASGPTKGVRAQYAPPYILRSGVRYSLRDYVKIAFTVTAVGEHSGADNNEAVFAIPAYQVLDLWAEATPFGPSLSFVAGISNLTDRLYWARVRPGGAGGQDPGLPRQIWVGIIARTP